MQSLRSGQAFQGLCHGNVTEYALRPKLAGASCRCDSAVPLCGSFGSEDPQCGSGDEVALKVEGVVNGGVQRQEALGGSSRLETLQLALDLPTSPDFSKGVGASGPWI